MVAGAYVFGTPVAVGHVRPLMPLARRLVERGDRVVWAISGDANEPAAMWRAQLEQIGVTLVDVDATSPFSRGDAPEMHSGGMIAALFRRIAGRANDVTVGAVAAIRAAVGDHPIRAGIYDYFGLWAYAALRRLDAPSISCVISAFPMVMDQYDALAACAGDVYQRELATLRASGVGGLESLRGGLIPNDPGVSVVSFTSPQLCPHAPSWIRLLGVQHGVLPRREDLSTASVENQALADRLSRARDRGERVVLLSMGTVVTRMFTRAGATHVGFLRRLYSELAASALRQGAIVVASTCDADPSTFGVDVDTLGPAARERVIAMKFVPQPLLFAHGLVDLMLMHGGANTFHETVVAGIPTLISPGFGDQHAVATAATQLGVGAALESSLFPSVPGAATIESAATELLPAMLAPGTTRWKAAALALAERMQREDGVAAFETLLSSRE